MTNVEKVFTLIDTYAESADVLYLEAIIDICNKWLTQDEVLEVPEDLSKEEIRRGIQLAILKGMQKNAQPHHQMTPDAIGMLIGHIAGKLVAGKERVSIFDPAVGTGNLLYTVMNSIESETMASAVEIDELLVRLSAVTAELLEHQVSFLVQDALRPLLIDPVDMAVSDLPVGYYPDDDNASNYELMPASGHAYAHHLFIEKSMIHTKPSGYGLFVVPANLFESEQSAKIQKYLTQHTIIRAIIQLPESLFKSVAHSKVILIIQKPFLEETSSPEVLLARVPNMKDKRAMGLFLQEIDTWAKNTK